MTAYVHIPSKLHEIAAAIGLEITHRPYTSKMRNGWLMESAKPFHLTLPDGKLVASFTTLDKLERNLRGRAGC